MTPAMAVTTNQAIVVCQSGYQPLIRSPLRRGGKTGAFNALEQYGTVAPCLPSIYAAPNTKFCYPTLPAKLAQKGSSSILGGPYSRFHTAYKYRPAGVRRHAGPRIT